MRVINTLPLLLDCLTRWEALPSEYEFEMQYAKGMAANTGGFFEGYYPELLDLEWKTYRDRVLKMDPVAEEERVHKHLASIENLFGFELEGEILLMGSFGGIDGFARFDRGKHRVFLGIDENFDNGRYIDILTTHELTHVARESRPEVWAGWGLDPEMERSIFLESMPLVEHIMNEGFSCVVSELLNPEEEPWLYVYQTRESLDYILKNGPALDRVLHEKIADPNADYSSLYNGAIYHPRQPSYAHYVWAWRWVRDLLKNQAGGDPRQLVARCSKDFIADALRFKLT
jgi:hypothetical protein